MWGSFISIIRRKRKHFVFKSHHLGPSSKKHLSPCLWPSRSLRLSMCSSKCMAYCCVRAGPGGTELCENSISAPYGTCHTGEPQCTSSKGAYLTTLHRCSLQEFGDAGGFSIICFIFLSILDRKNCWSLAADNWWYRVEGACQLLLCPAAARRAVRSLSWTLILQCWSPAVLELLMPTLRQTILTHLFRKTFVSLLALCFEGRRKSHSKLSSSN